MAKKSEIADIEKILTKGQLRKLNALRKSVGPAIGERAFVEWLKQANTDKNTEGDRNADLIAEAVHGVIREEVKHSAWWLSGEARSRLGDR